MKSLARRSMIFALSIGAFVGVTTTAAQALPLWDVKGPNRTSFDAAKRDLPAVEAQCREADGEVDYRTVVSESPFYYAFVRCLDRHNEDRRVEPVRSSNR